MDKDIVLQAVSEFVVYYEPVTTQAFKTKYICDNCPTEKPKRFYIFKKSFCNTAFNRNTRSPLLVWIQ